MVDHSFCQLAASELPHFLTALKARYEHQPEALWFRTAFAADDRQKEGCFRLFILLSVASIEVLIDAQQASYPALTPYFPAAAWSEREIYDLFGLRPHGPDGQPLDCQPLVLHRDWPHGKLFPMRYDFLPHQVPDIGLKAHCFEQPSTEGSHQVAVGPIHAGIIEPGHLRFTVTGETIHQFDAQLFYTHKGLEKMAQGKTLAQGLSLAENTCGMCAYAHSTAYCQAAEQLLGITVPPRALALRAIFQELERIASHLADLSAIAASGGLPFASVQAARLRETLLQHIQALTGHRFFRGINQPGGLTADCSPLAQQQLGQYLPVFLEEFSVWKQLFLGHEGVLDRLETTGFVSKEAALLLALVGPAARASGVQRDVRHDAPYGVYKEVVNEDSSIQFQVASLPYGDVLARTRIRIKEIQYACALIEALLTALPEGAIQVTSPAQNSATTGPAQNIMAYGAVESAKGELIHALRIDEHGKINRWHIRSASYMNWRGVVHATAKAIGGHNIVPDGPLVNKSFNLCYACSDK